MKPDIKCAIFDLDGTLLDSMGVWDAIDTEFFAKRGMPVPDDYMKMIAPMGFRQAAEYTVKRFCLNETPAALIDEWNGMAYEKYSNSVPLKPHAKELLEYLKSRGILIALATATAERLAVPALKNCGVYSLFDLTASTDRVARGKGFPDIYLYAAKTLGVRPENCAVFEDIPEGIRGARAAGMYSIAVFDSYSAAAQDTLRELADLYITDFAELLPENQ